MPKLTQRLHSSLGAMTVIATCLFSSFVAAQAPASAPPDENTAPSSSDGDDATPAAASPGATSPAEMAPDAAPPDTTSSTPAPAPRTAPAPQPAPQAAPPAKHDPANEADTWVRIDPEATQRLEACLKRPDLNGPEGQGCLMHVVLTSPNTTAALRAQTLLDIQALGSRLPVPGAGTDVAPAPSTDVDEDVAVEGASGGLDFLGDLPVSFRLTVGRLELSAAAGVFGIWNGIAGGIVAQSFFGTSVNPGLTILGAGAISAGLGAAFASAGFMLSDDNVLGSSGARLTTTGLAMGTVWGIAGAFAVADILNPANLDLDLVTAATVATIVTGGYAGAAAGASSAYFLELDAGQVSLINVGAAMGVLHGALVVPNLLVWNTPFWVNAGAFVGVSALGVGAGYVMSELIEMTWVEALIAGGGAVLGVAALTPATAAAGPFLGVPFNGPFAAFYYTAPAAIGSIAGFGIAAGSLLAWRYFHGETVLSEKWFGGLEPTVGSVVTVLDKEGKPVSLAPLVALRW